MWFLGLWGSTLSWNLSIAQRRARRHLRRIFQYLSWTDSVKPSLWFQTLDAVFPKNPLFRLFMSLIINYIFLFHSANDYQARRLCKVNTCNITCINSFIKQNTYDAATSTPFTDAPRICFLFLAMLLRHRMTNEQNDCAPSEDSDQPGHSPSLIWVFAVREMGSYGPKLSSCGQRRLIRLGECPNWSESSLGAHAILYVLSWGGSSVSVDDSLMELEN